MSEDWTKWVIGTLIVMVLGLTGFIACGWDSDIDSLQTQMSEVHREVGKLQKGQELIIQYLLTGDKRALSEHFKKLNEKVE